MTAKPAPVSVPLVVVLGVSGCGKSTVAEALSQQLGAEFFDADAFHPAANVQKMADGAALTDEDREPWLGALADLLRKQGDAGKPTVLACSALKRAYRQRLRVHPGVRFAYLHGSFELIQSRLDARQGHFMKSSLLESQFRTLEEPGDDEKTDTWTVEIDRTVKAVVAEITGCVGLPSVRA